MLTSGQEQPNTVGGFGDGTKSVEAKVPVVIPYARVEKGVVVPLIR